MKRFATMTGLLAVSVPALFVSCGNQSLPTADDVPAIIAEAQGTQSVAKLRDSPARRAVRVSFKTALYFDSVHEAEVGRRFRTPELRTYLMLSDSYVGGDFPRKIAVLLREVQQADQNYLQQVASFPTVLTDQLSRTDLPTAQRQSLEAEMAQAYSARQRPVVAAVTALDSFVQLTAQIYELMAANAGSVQSTRTGLQISNGGVQQRFNALVDRVNRAHEVADTAIRRLSPEQQARFTKMGVTKRIN